MGHTIKLFFDDARTLIIETSKGDISRIEDENHGTPWQSMELGDTHVMRLCYLACMRMARRGRLDADVPADYEQFRDAVIDYEVIKRDAEGKASTGPDQPTG